MRIWCDLDGVVISLTPAWLDAYNRLELEPPITVEQIVEYDFAKFVKYPKAFFSALCAGATSKAEPMPGAIAGVLELIKQGHDVQFVSYTLKNNRGGVDEKHDWLDKHGLGGVTLQCVPSAQKQYVMAAAIIEDYPVTVQQWLDRNLMGHAFLIDQPYNRDYSHPRCVRVHNVLEVAGLLVKGL